MAKFLNNSKCCDTDPNNTDPQTADCIDKWKVQHETACIDYNIANAKTGQAEARYTNSQMWELKLDKWFNNIKSTHEKADKIVVEIDFFIEQIITVCNNANCTTKGIETLLCKVKGIFDCLFSYQNGAKGIMEMVKDLKDMVECIDAQDKDAALECILNYKAKITAVFECQDEVLNKILETFKCAHLLLANICDEESGLKKILGNIQKEFKGESPEEQNHCAPDQGESPPATDDELPYPCDEAATKPKPTFPIENSEYYTTTNDQLIRAESLTKTYKKNWITEKKKRDQALALKVSLAQAIKAAEDAESGK